MKNNFWKMLFRNLLKYKAYNLLIIIGLSMGLACFTIIGLFVKHELTFDSSFKKGPSIYRITMASDVGGKINHVPTTLPPVGPLADESYGSVTECVRVINYKYSRLVPTLQVEDKTLYEEGIIFADSGFFSVFDFPAIQGKISEALKNPNSIVLTHAAAVRYFGEQNPVGKLIKFNNKIDLEVTAVLEDLPTNTHVQFTCVLPMSALQYSGMFYQPVLDSWQVDWFWTYLVIPNAQDVATVEHGINSLACARATDFVHPKFYLQSLRDVHLHSDFDFGTDLSLNGDEQTVFIFLSIGILILVISCINFVNLSMVLSTRRYREIGISKVLGATRTQLRNQFLSESVVVSVISLFICLGLVELIRPLFGNLLSVRLQTLWIGHPMEFVLLLGLTLLIGLISGLYPAVFVSSFDAQRVLKGVWKTGGGSEFRSTLLGVQIAISILLVVGTLVVYYQVDFVRSKDLGYDQDQVVMLRVRGTRIPQSYFAFKSKLESQSSIVHVSSVSEPIGREVQFMAFKVEGQQTDQTVKILNVGYDFVETMGLEVIEGRDFSRDHMTDSTAGFLINEVAAQHFGWLKTEAVGKGIQHALWPGAPEGKVIGLLKNFNFEPLHSKIDPLIVFIGYPAWFVAVRVSTGNTAQTLAVIERTWKEFEPDKPFNFQFLDQSIQNVYEKDERTGELFLIFSILSIVTVTLGLLGVISFILQQRMNEIGMRKVLGASVGNIIALFTRQHLRLILISFICAVPCTYYVMTNWLQNFEFRIQIHPGYFLAGGCLILVIMVGTVGLRVWKAASVNPVEVLRSE